MHVLVHVYNPDKAGITPGAKTVNKTGACLYKHVHTDDIMM